MFAVWKRNGNRSGSHQAETQVVNRDFLFIRDPATATAGRSVRRDSSRPSRSAGCGREVRKIRIDKPPPRSRLQVTVFGKRRRFQKHERVGRPVQCDICCYGVAGDIPTAGQDVARDAFLFAARLGRCQDGKFSVRPGRACLLAIRRQSRVVKMAATRSALNDIERRARSCARSSPRLWTLSQSRTASATGPPPTTSSPLMPPLSLGSDPRATGCSSTAARRSDKSGEREKAAAHFVDDREHPGAI